MTAGALIYFACYEIALVLFVVLARALLPKGHGRDRQTFVLTLAYLGGMFYAAHGFYFLLVEKTLTNTGAKNFWLWMERSPFRSAHDLLPTLDAFMDSTVGLWGGPFFVIALVLAFLMLLRDSADNKAAILDACAIALPFSLAVAKAGCYANGCCWGVEGSGPLYVSFSWLPTADGRSFFPTQLLDQFNFALVGAVLVMMRRRGKGRGRLLLWFVLLYSIVRFGSETTRGDHVGGELAGLSPVQWAVAVGAALSIALLVRPSWLGWLLGLRSARNDAAPTDEPAHARTYLIVLIVSSVLWLPQLLLAPIFALLMIADWGRTVAADKIAYQIACMSVGLLWITASLIPSLLPFLVVSVGAFVGVSLLFDRSWQVG